MLADVILPEILERLDDLEGIGSDLLDISKDGLQTAIDSLSKK